MTSSLPAAVDLAATSIAVAAMVLLHVEPTGLSPARDSVSQYGITRYRQGYRVLTLALGVAGLATTFPRQQRSTIVGLLAVFGLCRLAISWWPMDAPGRPRSRHGTVHVILAAAAFVTITIAANLMRHAAAQPEPVSGTGYHHALDVAFWLLVTGLAGLLITRRLDARYRYFGAAERLIYAGIYVLLIATGAHLL